MQPSCLSGSWSLHQADFPAFHQVLHQAGDRLLNVSVAGDDEIISAFATTHAGGSSAGVEGLQIFVTNFSPMEGATATPKNATAQDISLTIKAAAGATMPTTAFLWRIDDNSTRAFAAWQDMGSPEYPTPAELAELHDASEMKAEELTVAAGGRLAFHLPPYAVGVVRFSDAAY